jgi:hypothetical protein
MAIVMVSRWAGNAEKAIPIAREAGALVKKHGADSVRIGPCFSGAHAGQIYVAIVFANWATFARAQQAMAQDTAFQKLYAEASKHVELQDRSIIISEEV